MNKLLCIALLALSFNANAAEWECIHRNLGCDTWRMPTPKGWIVESIGYREIAMTYVPDENHEWKI